MNNKVTVLGSCHACHVFCANEIPNVGETYLGDRYSVDLGGKGSNQAIAARCSGSEVTLIERMGQDEYGREMKKRYSELEINHSHVTLDESIHSGVGGVFVRSDGNNSIIIVPGANMRVSRADIDAAAEDIYSSSILGAVLEIPVDTVSYAFRMACAHGIETFLDPAPVVEFPSELYSMVSYIKPNEHEASLLTGIKVIDAESSIKAGQWFIEHGVKKAAIITLGEKGAAVVTKDKCTVLEPIKTKVINTGGAGDTFAGAFISALAQGRCVVDACRFAQCASAIKISIASDLFPTRAMIEKLYNDTQV